MSKRFGLKRGWTPFPNALIDFYLPKLSDTAWRVLVVIVRQSLGWQGVVVSDRRHRERLSQRQLKKRTGRQSAAISAAIEQLSLRSLITICDAQGNVLDSPPKRRRAKATLHFQLAPWIIHSISTETRLNNQNRSSKSEENKRYLDKRNNKEKSRKPVIGDENRIPTN